MVKILVNVRILLMSIPADSIAADSVGTNTSRNKGLLLA